MTKNTKTLLWVAGLGAVAYYFWMKNKKAKVAAPKAPANFTGDLGVPEYQNYYGVKVVPRYGTTAAQSEFASTHQNVPAWATQGATK